MKNETWRAVLDRRNTEFHRMRPQTIDGWVPQVNPSVQYREGTDEHEAGCQRDNGNPLNPYTPDVAPLVDDSEVALNVLVDTMVDWAEGVAARARRTQRHSPILPVSSLGQTPTFWCPWRDSNPQPFP